MTKINDDTIDKLAHLARLEFDGAEKVEIKKDLTRMLDFVGKLNKLDTTGVEPLVYMNSATNILRNDDAQQTITQAEALSNAPKKDSDYFKVPKVLSK